VREYVWLYETEIAPTSGSRTTADRPLAVVDAVNTASSATWWVSVDHLNRPVKMTNSAKAAVWTAVWQPWGAAQSITGSATLNARFPGQWFQVEAGLHYNWHRHYDPSLGRYTQPDPLEFVDGPSVYGYVGGSPVRFVDFPGLDVLTFSGSGVFAGTLGGMAGGGVAFDTSTWTFHPYSQTGPRVGMNVGASVEIGWFTGDLESFSGWSNEIDGTFGPVSGSRFWTTDKCGRKQRGITVGWGYAGTPAGLSMGKTFTWFHNPPDPSTSRSCGCD